MKIRYFQDTDTLHIEFRAAEVGETCDLDEATLIDLDQQGAICGITVEHASERAEIPKFSYEQTGTAPRGSETGPRALLAAAPRGPGR